MIAGGRFSVARAFEAPVSSTAATAKQLTKVRIGLSEVEVELRKRGEHAEARRASRDVLLHDVDPQIGVIAELGREAGIPTPGIRCLVGLIHDIEDGRRPMAYETFEILIQVCQVAQSRTA